MFVYQHLSFSLFAFVPLINEESCVCVCRSAKFIYSETYDKQFFNDEKLNDHFFPDGVYLFTNVC